MPDSKKNLNSVEKKFVIKNKLGLHARPAALFVQTANKFNADIEVRKGRENVNGKSIMGIMTLAAGLGTAITVKATGADAQEAIDALNKLFEENFGEEDSKK